MIDLAREAEFDLGGVGVKPALRMFGEEQVEPRVMQVLVALARRAGGVVTRDDLITQCWDGRAVSEDAIHRPIGRLRKLGEDTCAFEIETITKVGYRLMDAKSEVANQEAQLATATRGVVLAVLAFDNLSPDPNMSFFSDGVSDEILLTVSRSIWTIGRASSFQFRGADKAMAKVAAELGATHVLDGSVRCNGDLVRVSAQLIDAATQLTLWQSQYERPARDLFAVQDEIAIAVASALKCRLSMPAVGGPIDPESHEKYVRAREERCSNGAGDLAIGLLNEALERAPNFAPAWVELAFTQIGKLRGGLPVEERQRLFEETRFAVDRAISLSGEDVARQFEATFQPVCGGWTAREAIFRSLLTERPHDILLLTPLSSTLDNAGRLAESLPLARQIYEREPLHAGTARNYALVLGALGRHDEEMAIYERACRRWPEQHSIWSMMISSAAELGRWDIIERNTRPEQLARFPRDATLVRQALRTVAIHRETGPHRGERLIARMCDDLESTGRLRLTAIGLAARFGDLDILYALVERASFSHLFNLREGSIPGDGFTMTLFLAFAKRLRSDPRFVTLCARLGMVTHWIEVDRWPDCAKDVRYDFRAEARRLHEQRLDLREQERSA